MYSALHIMQWFSQLLDVFTPKIKRKFFDFYIYESKQMSLTQDLRWSLGRSRALQLQRQTDLLLCTINCFLQWDHLPNMAVGDLAFYYTLYLWSKVACKPRNLKGGIWSLFNPCVNAMGPRPFWRSRMEVSYCTSGFGVIIRRDLSTLSLACVLPRDNLNTCMI